MVDRYARLRSFYADFKHADDEARRVGWRCFDDQMLRFEVLLEGIAAEDYPVSVLDVGCGLGALYGLLESTDRLGGYLGIDLLPEMVAYARERYPKGRFVVADLLQFESNERFDIAVCSGSLNVVVRNHEHWVRRMLEAMYERARMAVLVNFQWTRAYKVNPVSRFDEDIYHVDRDRLLSWCEKLSPWITLRQDFVGEDLAVYIYKDYHRTLRRLQRERRHDPRPEAEQICGLAELLLERQLPAQALELLKNAEPTALVLHFTGLCHHRMGDERNARKYYERALELDPSLEMTKLNLDWITQK